MPWTVAHKAPLSMGFPRTEYWSGLPFPPPGDLPNPGIELGSSTLQADSLPCEPLGKLSILQAPKDTMKGIKDRCEPLMSSIGSPASDPGPPGSEGWMFSALGQGCWLAYVCEMEQKGREYGGILHAFSQT